MVALPVKKNLEEQLRKLTVAGRFDSFAPSSSQPRS
jgi:hypothetical protein